MKLITKVLNQAVWSILSLILPLSLPAIAFADVIGDRLNQLENATDETTFTQYIYELAIPLSVASLVGLFVYAAFLMITSQGNPEKLAEAKETIVNAVLGFAMVALSVALLVLLGSTLNIV
jgi:ABC-type uncharacterized transport system permease subunit